MNNYSFQDIDYILKDLENKGAIIAINNKYFIKRDYSRFALTNGLESHEVKPELLIGSVDNSKNAKKFLEYLNLIVDSVKKAYLR